MRQSKMTKAMALMLSFVMITSVFVGNTLSRYVTSVSSTDNARVAVWGINGEDVTMELFNTQYDLDGKLIAKSNVNGEKIIAPGTGGQSAFSIINFESDTIPPEVAYDVKISLDDSEVDPKIINNTSIQWKLDNSAWGTFDELKTSILNLSGDSSGLYTFAPGEFAEAFKGDVEHTIYWQWAMDGNNEVDTQMGNDALTSDIGVKITVSITAEQSDGSSVNMLDGANQVINIYNAESVTFRSVAPAADLQEVKVNNETVDPSNYEVKEGSTIIIFKKAFLETLTTGTYTIDIISKNMTATAKFFVKEEYSPIVHNGIIPEGGTYYVGVDSIDGPGGPDEQVYLVGDYESADTIYNAGDNFPEPQNGDIYVYGDYEYRYNCEIGSTGLYLWYDDIQLNGWGVAAVNKEKIKYGAILTTVNGKDIVSLNNAFKFFSNLKVMPIIPESVVYMDYTFEGCSSLEKVTSIPSGVERLYYTFLSCTSLKKAPMIPNNVKYMEGTFTNCASLEEAPVIPDSVESLEGAFVHCISLKKAPIIPSSVKNINDTFVTCDNLEGEIIINSNPTQYQNTFSGTKINSIVGETTIAREIAEASGIKILIVHDGGDASKKGIYYTGVTGIETGNYSTATDKYINGAMPEVVNTGDIYVEGDYEYRFNMSYNFESDWSNGVSLESGWGVRVLDDSKEEYGEILSHINGKNIVYLNGTFYNCENLKVSPIIPDTVKDMSHTFRGCTDLTTVTNISNQVEYMASTFDGCTSLVNAPEIPNSVSVAVYTFNGCTSLTEAPVVSSNAILIDSMFKGCSSLSGSIEVNSDPYIYNDFIKGTQITEIVGSTTLKAELLATK